MELTELDRRMLTEIQSGFPLTEAPYCELGERLGVPEVEALEAVLKLRETGVVRRMGPVFDSHRLGYSSTLAALTVPDERVDEVAALIGGYPNVTHSYLREDRYNLWFTVIAESRARVEEVLAEIVAGAGISELLDLPAIRLYKIRVDFDLTGERASRAVPEPVTPSEVVAVTLTEDEKELARIVQDDLPWSERPYAEVAAELQKGGIDVTEAWVLERLRAWVEVGAVRRFGAAVRHHKAGFTANAMGVWSCPGGRCDEVGAIMAGFAEVSHCYRRPNTPEWPWDLYTMLHGRTRAELEDAATRVRVATGLDEPRLLYSARELKKSSMRYFAE